MQLKTILILLLLSVNLSFAGSVTITLVGHNPLTVNVKGTTVDEEAAGLSIFIYFNSSDPSDATTQLSASDVNSTFLTNTFGWTNFETKTIETGPWLKGGVTYSSRLNYAISNVGTANDDVWPTSGVNALVLNFNPGGPGRAYIELNGTDGVPDYSHVGHTVIFVNQTVVPLPVELSSFTASISSNNINLNWKTATEVNNNGFDVQRSVKNSEVRGQKSEVSGWQKIGFVQGHGNSNSPKDYIFTDKNVTGGTKFLYRLKQIDNDGQYTYSKEVEVEVVPKVYALYQNYPNPFNPTTSIKFDLPEASRVTLNVYNIIGQQVASLINSNIEAGYHSVTFSGSNLPSGTYIYRLQTDNFVQVKKMVLLK